MKLYCIFNDQHQVLFAWLCHNMKIQKAGPHGDGLHRMTLTFEDNTSIELRISERFTVKEFGG